MLVLGIETSCDETSVAVVQDGCEILSNVVSSQEKAHAAYGGVVPEIASRQHLQQLEHVLKEALRRADTSLADVEALAVTAGPGLVGALLVGVSFAKGLSWGRRLPLKGVHHLEGHIAAVELSHPGRIDYPALALVVSGGHTHMYLQQSALSYRLLGRTLDDAAGEAFDKVGKHLGMTYPAGPAIDRLAEAGRPGRYALPRASVEGRPLDFSFSGLKTATARLANTLPEGPEARADLLAEFREAVVDMLGLRLEAVIASTRPRTVLVTGGVAANSLLRRRGEQLAERHGVPILFPDLSLTSDNAAMIAAAGHRRLTGEPPDDLQLDARATWDLAPAREGSHP